MTADEIEAERLKRAMSYTEFGRWLADEINAGKPESEHVKPYGRTRVYEWVHGNVAVPAKVEILFKDLEIADLKQRLGERDEDKPNRDREPSR